MSPEKLGYTENPKRDIHGSTMGRKNRQELLRKLKAREGKRGWMQGIKRGRREENIC